MSIAYAVGVTQERRAATDEEARAMASPLRVRILRLCLDQPLTNKQIAEVLGRDPATVLHHVRTLVRAGFLAAEQERRGPRGSREVPYRATGKSWRLEVIDPERDRTHRATLVQAFIDDVHRIGLDTVTGARLGLRLTAAEREELERRIQELLDEYAGRRSDGEPWSLFVGLHPDDRPVGSKPDAPAPGP
jgi:DNA-binding transcriptional ArsR family regulator